MRFLVEAQLPIGLARMLQQHGHESKHVADLRMMQTSDKDNWRWAKQNKSIIISKDEDFVIIHNAEEKPVPLIWVRVGNTRRKELLEWFERLLPIIEEKLASGELLVELI
jgi:predicted nuclease of predicted toxin-antitoxin system